MAREAAESDRSMVEGTRDYLTGVRGEFRKVTWPSRKETVGGTIGVLVVVGVITLVLSLVDLGLANVVRLVLP